jgi:hypothetical protein
MATPEEVAALRLLIAEPEDTDPYTDPDLSARLDAAGGNANLVAYEVWTEKAAATAGMVDVSEGGSSRKMGDLYEQALSMAANFASRATAETLPPDGAGTVRIKRLTRP